MADSLEARRAPVLLLGVRSQRDQVQKEPCTTEAMPSLCSLCLVLAAQSWQARGVLSL